MQIKNYNNLFLREKSKTQRKNFKNSNTKE